MSRSLISTLMRSAELLADRDGMVHGDDHELLSRFAESRDEQAFATIVRRHGPMVWSICRNMLGHEADAEDAFQACFLALMRSAKSIRRRASLASWLHGVAFRVSMRSRRSAVRARQRDVRSARPEASAAVAEQTWDELHAFVHREIQALPAKLREAFVMCGLEGSSQQEVAEQLGCKTSTVSANLSRARQRLMERLQEQGIPLAILAGVTACASGISRALVQKALAVQAGPVTDSVHVLARGATSMSFRTKMATVAALATCLLTVGIGLIPRADGQTKEIQDQLEQKLRALSDQEQLKSKWEYRYEPIVGALSRQKFEATSRALESESWEYCGTQELTEGTTQKFLVFKRPRTQSTGRKGSTVLLELPADDKTQKIREIEAKIVELHRMLDTVWLTKDSADLERRRQGQLDAARAAELEREKLSYSQMMERYRKAFADKEGHGDPLKGAAKITTFALKHAVASDLAKLLGDTVSGVAIGVDARTNSLVVSGEAGKIQSLSNLISALDRPAPAKK